jgi:CRP-like cAMP-binding protein
MALALEYNTLRKNDLFADLSSEDLDRIVQTGRFLQREAGDYLFHQGEAARYMYLLVEGRLKLIQLTPEGQQVIVRYIGPGETFAILAVLRQVNYPVAAQVVQDATVMIWDRATMKRMMKEFPGLGHNALQIMSERVQEFQDRIRELSTERVERRIARSLLRLARQAGRRVEEGVVIDLPLSRQDLAEMAGTTLYTVSRTLSQWESDGLVKCGRARVTVTSPHQLVVIAEDLPQKSDR